MRSIVKLSFLLIATVLVFSSCASKKRKGEPGAFKKFYHNTTAKYNGYFNADELMKESFSSLEEQNQDNYNQILHVYPYSAAENPKASAEDLDLAIEKVTTVALLHEPSHWVDDCYLLMGKAQFLKQDYESAEETLEYFQEEFDPYNPNGRMYKNKGKKSAKEKKKERDEERKEAKKIKEEEKKAREKAREDAKKEREKAREDAKKERERKIKERRKNKRSNKKRTTNKTEETKKEETKVVTRENTTTKKKEEANEDIVKKKEEKPELKPEGGGLFGHTPAFYEGVLWLARTYIERENFYTAEYLLGKLENEYPITDEVRREIYPARAYMYIKQKKYTEALPALDLAIDKSKDKKLKARYAYIAAQIHQNMGNYDKANSAFKRVGDFKPSFEMEFNTKLNIEKTQWSNGDGSKQLTKLLKEDKYAEFKDQIYYAMGDIKMSQKNYSGAIKDFENSLKFNESNTSQKIESYHRLANLYFEKEEYINAKQYFDSTLVVMEKEDERYFNTEKYAKGLTDIAKYLGIVNLQDSLLRLGTLSKEELQIFAKAELEKQKEAEALVDNSQETTDKFAGLTPGRRLSGPSSFFAYNQSSVRKGKESFKEKWGNRKLEDNWRRSNRNDASENEEEEEEVFVDEGVTDEDIAQFLRTIPTTPPQRAKAETELEDALFNLGIQYRDNIQNYEKSIGSLEELRSRFPETKNDLDALYYLYLSNLDLANSSRAAYYKDIISKNYPETKYARALNDPNFSKELEEEAKSSDRHYDATYALFTEGQYQEAYNRAIEVDGTNSTPLLLPKYSLLAAMCTGHLKGKEDYISALNEVSKRHPNTPESVRAKEIMRFLKGDDDAFDKALYEEESDVFEFEENKLHYVILVVYESNNKKVNDTKIALSNYHKTYHKLDKLKITDIYLNVEDKSKVVLVRKFRNKDKAMSYVDGTKKNSKDFVNDKEVSYDIFAISQKNYREVIKEKSVVNYRAFYEKYYPTK